MGKDNYGGDIERVPVSSYDDCNAICNKDPRCRRWSYVNDESWEPFENRECIIKTSKSEYGIHSLLPIWNKITGFRNITSGHCGVDGMYDFTSKGKYFFHLYIDSSQIFLCRNVGQWDTNFAKWKFQSI